MWAVRTPSLRLRALTLTLNVILGAGCAGGRGAATRPVAAPAPAPGPAGALRVMTFNIRYGTAPDGDNAWPNRRALVFRVIRDFGPAVLGLQEALRFQLDEVRRELPTFGEVGVGRDDGLQAGEYAAILYDRNRLEPLDEGHFWLSESPDLPGSMSWGARYPRIVTWARFRDRSTRGVFLAVNTHWDHESQEAREMGAFLMLHRLRPVSGVGDPLLIVGDLNCARGNPAFRILEGLSSAEPENRPEWTDTFEVMFPRGVAGSGTFHAFSGDRGGAKIDFVLVWPLWGRAPPDMFESPRKQWRVLQADIVHTNENGRYPSDHFPVTATVLLVDAPASGQPSTM